MAARESSTIFSPVRSRTPWRRTLRSLIHSFCFRQPPAGRAPGSCLRSKRATSCDCASAANAAFNNTFATGGNADSLRTERNIHSASDRAGAVPEVELGDPERLRRQRLYLCWLLRKPWNPRADRQQFGKCCFRTRRSWTFPRFLRLLNLRRLRRFPAPESRTTTESLLRTSIASRCGAAVYFSLTTYTGMRSISSQTADSTRSRTNSAGGRPQSAC